jgi:hypothetical protein
MTTAPSTIPVLHRRTGLPKEPCILVERRIVASRTGLASGHVDERPLVCRVSALGAEPARDLARPVYVVEYLFGPQVFDANAVNTLGTRGAYVTQHPSEEAIAEAVGRAHKALLAGRDAYTVRRDVPSEPNPVELCSICRAPTTTPLGQHASPRPVRCDGCEAACQRAYARRAARRATSAALDGAS